MPDQELVVTLSIREVATPVEPVFSFHVWIDSEIVASNQYLSVAQSQVVRQLSSKYVALFEQRVTPLLTSDALEALGDQLFDVWLVGTWPKVESKIRVGILRILVIASDSAEVLNLPWELLRPAGGGFTGLDPKFALRRVPWSDRKLADYVGSPPPGPLRILFMASAPEDQAPLDYEREEKFLLQAIGKAGPNVIFDSCDLGTFEELRQRINEFKPHVVHMTGHGVVRDAIGYFDFEDDHGRTDERSALEIRRQLFAGSGVQCVFVSGCETGKAPPTAVLGGICQGLVGDEISLAIGWAASIADDIATGFATTFYNTVVSGQSVDRALVQARQAVYKICEDRGDPSWTLPVLYASTRQRLVYDPPAEPAVVRRPSVVQQPLPGITEGYTEHFVDRRRELQRLLPALRDGSLQTVLITGIGGVGKSTLATRIVRKLEAEGFNVIPVSSTESNPLSAARLLQICGDIFLGTDLHDAYATVRDAELPVHDRLRYIVTVLNRRPFVIVLDNFDINMDAVSRKILDSELASFYIHLVTHLAGRSRAILTCRYTPADLPTLPQTAGEVRLGEFSESDFLKFLLLDPTLEKRFYTGELPHELLIDLYRGLGGTPRFLAQVRQALKLMTHDNLRRELSSSKLEDATELQELRDRYIEQIFITRLYANLSPDSRRALSQVAVYSVAVNLEGFAVVTGLPAERLREFTQRWHSHALVYPRTASELWAVYGLIRHWLMAPERLDPDSLRVAHRSAGDFLNGMAQQRRQGELELSWVDCLLESRAHYLAAGDYVEAKAVTDRVSKALALWGLYGKVEQLNRDLLAFGQHPGPMAWIALARKGQGDFPSARGWLERGLKILSDPDSEDAAFVTYQLALVDLSQGKYEAARENFVKSFGISQRIGYQEIGGAIWHGLASIDLEQGKYEAAREKFQKALPMQQRVGDRLGEANTWHNLASIDAKQSSYGEAQEKFRQALEILREIGARSEQIIVWNGLARIDLEQGRLAEAREKYQEVLNLCKQIGNLHGESVALHNLAVVDHHQGNYEAAHDKLEMALEIKRRIGDRAGEAATLAESAAVHADRHNHTAALEHYQEALKISQQIGDRMVQAQILSSLGVIAINQHDYGSAQENLKRALKLNQEMGNRAGEAAIFIALGVFTAQQNRVANGIRLVALSYVLNREMGHRETKESFQALMEMASQLNYTQAKLDALLRQVAKAYRKDKGSLLIKAALRQD